MRHRLIKVLVLACMLASCSVPQAESPTLPALTDTPLPKKTSVIEYPPPNLPLNTQGFSDTGCEGKLTEKSCASLIALGCEAIFPADLFGGLKPSYAVMECIHENGEPQNKDYFRRGMCLDRSFRSHVIFQDGKYRLIAKESEFQSTFAPIESTDEALSYALAVTSLFPSYNIEVNSHNVYFVDVIEETHVNETPEGYLVHLFDSDHQCGCALHPIYAVDILVTRDGETHEIKRQEVYRRNICVD